MPRHRFELFVVLFNGQLCINYMYKISNKWPKFSCAVGGTEVEVVGTELNSIADDGIWIGQVQCKKVDSYQLIKISFIELVVIIIFHNLEIRFFIKYYWSDILFCE